MKQCYKIVNSSGMPMTMSFLNISSEEWLENWGTTWNGNSCLLRVIT